MIGTGEIGRWIARYLKAIEEGFANGSLTLRGKEGTIVLEPDGLIGLTVRASRKRGRMQLSFKVNWKTKDRPKKGKPDTLVISSWGEDVRHFIKQAKAKGLFDQIAVFGWFTYDMTADIGHEVPEGMWCLARGGPFNYLESKYPVAGKFVQKSNEQFKAYPNGYTICTYDSLIAWKQAVLKAKTD